MNAEIVPGLPRQPHRDDYIPIVKGFMPFCDGEALKLRCSLLLMRDRAIATKPIASASGWILLDLVEKEVDAIAFQGMTIEQLRLFRYLCLRCVGTASSFDSLYQSRPAWPEEQGEAHAGG